MATGSCACACAVAPRLSARAQRQSQRCAPTRLYGSKLSAERDITFPTLPKHRDKGRPAKLACTVLRGTAPSTGSLAFSARYDRAPFRDRWVTVQEHGGSDLALLDQIPAAGEQLIDQLLDERIGAHRAWHGRVERIVECPVGRVARLARDPGVAAAIAIGTAAARLEPDRGKAP